MKERRCFSCNSIITLCNGAMKAGDYLQWLQGKRLGETVRELCGKCALICRWTEDSKLLTLTPEEVMKKLTTKI